MYSLSYTHTHTHACRSAVAFPALSGSIMTLHLSLVKRGMLALYSNEADAQSSVLHWSLTVCAGMTQIHVACDTYNRYNKTYVYMNTHTAVSSTFSTFMYWFLSAWSDLNIIKIVLETFYHVFFVCFCYLKNAFYTVYAVDLFISSHVPDFQS